MSNDRKLCPDCGQEKLLEDFSSDRARVDGWAFYCAPCARLRHQRSRDARRTGPLRSRHRREKTVPGGDKWCPDCDQTKPLGEFPRNRSTGSGYAPYCKPCHNLRGRRSKEKVGGTRGYHLKRRYGITAADADAMLAAQSGVCAICRVAPAAHVDQDHATGKVRGLLCFNCNGGLGQFKDQIDVVEAAAAYLRSHAPHDEVAPAAAAAPTQRWPRVIEMYPQRGAEIDVERWRHPIGA